MTGLSGSGKSSLAFDTIYADGQRRYVESLSSYARMFLGQMDKPDVDEITGLSPAISIDQKTTSHNPRSTVGTVTEIYDYLRLLYARIGVPHCPVCGRVISQQTVDEMVDAVLKLEEGTKFQVLAPVVRQRKGTQQKELDAARRAGYARVKIDGNLYDLDEEISWKRTSSIPWKSWWTALPCARASAAVWRIRWRPRWPYRRRGRGGRHRRRSDDLQPELCLPGARHFHQRLVAAAVLLQ